MIISLAWIRYFYNGGGLRATKLNVIPEIADHVNGRAALTLGEGRLFSFAATNHEP